jgi:hypothetical protein
MLPGAGYPVSCRATWLNAPHGSPNNDVRRYFEKRLYTTTRSVEFFNRLLIRPGDVLVPSPAPTLKIYPRIHRSGVIPLLSLGLPRRVPVFRQMICLLLGLSALAGVSPIDRLRPCVDAARGLLSEVPTGRTD